MENVFIYYLQDADKRSHLLEADLVKFVKENSNFIDLRKFVSPRGCSAFIYDDVAGQYMDNRVLALTTYDNGTLGVLCSDIYCVDEYTNMSVDELLECDTWYTPFGGYMDVNASLLNICECICAYKQANMT